MKRFAVSLGVGIGLVLAVASTARADVASPAGLAGGLFAGYLVVSLAALFVVLVVGGAAFVLWRMARKRKVADAGQTSAGADAAEPKEQP